MQTVHNWSVCVWKHNRRPLNWSLSGSPPPVPAHGLSLLGGRPAQKWGGQGTGTPGRAIVLRADDTTVNKMDKLPVLMELIF